MVDIDGGQAGRKVASVKAAADSETALVVAQEDSDIVRPGIEYGQIEMMIAVKIGDRDADRLAAGEDFDGVGQRATRFAEKDTDRVRAAVRDDDVVKMVAIEVADGDG